MRRAPLISSTLLILCGLCWIGFGLAFLLCLLLYLAEFTGCALFGFLYPSLFASLDLVHVVGFTTGAGVCFAVGVGMCAQGLPRSN